MMHPEQYRAATLGEVRDAALSAAVMLRKIGRHIEVCRVLGRYGYTRRGEAELYRRGLKRART